MHNLNYFFLAYSLILAVLGGFFAYLFARVRTLEGEIGRLAPPQEDASRDSNGGLAP